MFHLNFTYGAGVGSFVRTFVKSLARTEHAFWESHGPIVAPRAVETAPARGIDKTASRRASRLIDLERRAKFGQFGPTSR